MLTKPSKTETRTQGFSLKHSADQCRSVHNLCVVLKRIRWILHISVDWKVQKAVIWQRQNSEPERQHTASQPGNRHRDDIISFLKKYS